MSRTLKVMAEVQLPRVPNYLLMGDGKVLPVSAVSEQDLRELGRQWTEQLVARAQEQQLQEMDLG